MLARVEFFISAFELLSGRKSTLETGIEDGTCEVCVANTARDLTVIVRFHIRTIPHYEGLNLLMVPNTEQ